MTRVVSLERATRRRYVAWSAVALGLCAAAGVLTVVTGGQSVWIRMVLAALAVERLRAAIRHRTGVAAAIVPATAAVLIVPDDARVDRTLLSATVAILIVAAAEAAHVARRLVTVAPVGDTRRDVRWLVRLATLAAAGTATAALSARLLPAAWITAAIGLGVAAAAWTSLWATRARTAT